MILNWLLALASAVILVALYPGYGIYLLAPVALTPLLVACGRETNWKERALFGYVSGIVYWFGLCNWIQWTLAHHAGVSDIVAWLLFLLFCLAKAVQTGIFAALAGPLMRRWYGPPGVAALWVVLERSHAWTGFEWLHLGNAASEMKEALSLAPITGVWGLSFLLAVIGAVIAAIVLRRNRLQSLWLVPLFAVNILLPPVPQFQKGNVTAVVLQPNFDEETLWTDSLLTEAEKRLQLFTDSLGQGAEIAVWPEMPAPFLEKDARFQTLLHDVATKSGMAVLSGVIARTADGMPLNSAELVDAKGAEVSRYDKVNLVPFGEFVPWPFGVITKQVSNEAGEFAPGNKVVVSQTDGHRLGAFICYESVFPGFTRQFARDGAEALFNISNDGWFGKSAARYQHLQIVRMRAAENARWIVRATNNGVSAVIDPAGRIVERLPEYQESAARVQFRWRSDQTFYALHGDWFVVACLVIAIAAIAASALPEHRRA